MTHDWDERYASGDLPWDSGEPDAHLIDYVESGGPPGRRVLEVGCGTGTNALWLASRGFEVTGVDISPRAVAAAEAKARDRAVTSVRFSALDFLAASIEHAPFDFVFDRGVFHVFDDAPTRARFAERVAAVLDVGGRWLSIVGSTEGPPRDHGPPRRTARELVEAVEPVLEIVQLRSSQFDHHEQARAWLLLAGIREVSAQPSTRRG